MQRPPAPRPSVRDDEHISGPFETASESGHLLSTPLDALEAEVLLMTPESADGFYNRARMKELHRRASVAQHRMEVFAPQSVFDDLRAMIQHDRSMAHVVESSSEFEDLRDKKGFQEALDSASGSF
jgi:hypothetical protein